MSGGPGHLWKTFRNQYFSFLSTRPLPGDTVSLTHRCGATSWRWRVSGGSQSRAGHSALLSKADVTLAMSTAPAPSEACADSSGCHRPEAGQAALGQK